MQARLGVFVVAFCFVVISGVSRTALFGDDEATELSRKTKQQLVETVLPAFASGDIDGFLIALAPIIDKLDVNQFQALDKFGKSHSIPSIRGEFTNLVLRSVEQKRNLPLDLSARDVAFFLLTGISERIESELAEFSSAPEMANSVVLPDRWDEREKTFWNIHVFRNRFLNLAALANFAHKLAETQLKIRKNIDDPARKEALEKFAALPAQVQAENDQLLNNEAMLRLDELWIAEDALKNTMNFADRLYAAYALEDDGRSLLDFLRKFPTDRIAHERLREEGLSDKINELLASGRRHGTDVIEKALLLRVGAHWWLRGRYGAGPLNEGLMKAPEAMDSAEMMVGLYMPQLPNKPISDYLPAEKVTPGYERRHYYVWAIERRDKNMVTSGKQSYDLAKKGLDGSFFF